MSASLIPTPVMQFFDSNGDPLSGGKVYTYAAGTSTPLATYTDQGGATPNANPVILDSRGEAAIWFGGSSYKLVLKTSADVLIWTADNVTAALASLAASTGSSLIGFIQAGTGAVATTVDTVLQDLEVNIRRFGATQAASGATNSAAFAAANSYLAGLGGGTILIPRGTYTFSADLALSSFVNVKGDGRYATKVKYTGSNECFDGYGASYCKISDLAVLTDAGGTTTAIRFYGSNNICRDLIISEFTAGSGTGWGTGISFEGSTNLSGQSSFNVVESCYIEHVRTVGLRVTRATETQFTDIQLWGTANNTTAYGILLETGAAGVYFKSVSSAFGSRGLLIQSTLSTGTGPYNAAPQHIFGNQLVLDTTTGGHSLEAAASLSTSYISANFVDCWFAGAGVNTSNVVVTAGSHGVQLGGGTGWSFTGGCRVRANAGNGVSISSANVSNVKINGNHILGNNEDNNADQHGVYVSAAATYISIENNRIGNVLDLGGHQKYGIKISAVASTGTRLINNDVTGNDSGGYLNGDTSGTVIVRDTIDAAAVTSNPNQQWTSTKLGANGRLMGETFSVAAAGTKNLTHYISGGIAVVRDNTDGGTALFYTDETTGMFKISGSANIVAGAAGASQIGLSANIGGPTQLSNGYGATKSVSVSYLSATG